MEKKLSFLVSVMQLKWLVASKMHKKIPHIVNGKKIKITNGSQPTLDKSVFSINTFLFFFFRFNVGRVNDVVL